MTPGPSNILSNLGLSRFERMLGVLLFAVVVAGLVLGKLTTSEAAAMLVTLTGVAAAISTGRKTGAEAADTYASAAKKASEQSEKYLELNKILSERVDALELQAEDDRREIAELKRRLSARENRVKTLEEQNARMRIRLDEKDHLLKSHQEQLTKLTEAVLQKDIRIDELESLSGKQREEIAALRLEVEQLRAASMNP
jgi:chromosome segregation ATPase